MLEKKAGINVKLNLVLGLLLLPGRNEKLIVPMLGIPVGASQPGGRGRLEDGRD